MRFQTALACFAASLLFAAPSDTRAQCPDQAAVAAYVADLEAGRPSRGFGNTLTLAEAECARAKLALALPAVLGKPVGYKAAFTNQAAQQRMRLPGPSWAVMFANNLVESGVRVPAASGAGMRYEPDLIVVVRDSGLQSAKTPLEALEHIEAIVPFIELPALSLEGQPSGAAYVATNIGFRGGVLGQRIKVRPDPELLNALAAMQVITTDDRGVELGRARGELLLGNPINVVLWLAAELGRHGIELKAGDLLSLGAFRPPEPTRPGLGIRVRYVGLPGDPEVAVHFE